MTNKENFLKGFIKENSVFVMMLGMCPSIATTKNVESALGMGLLITISLIGSNILISSLRKLIAEEIRIPAYIVVIATFVTIIKILTDTFLPALAESLGVFIPLIVVNCLILGRAEAFASKNKVIPSLIDGISMGLGTCMALVIIAFFREMLGSGSIIYGVYLPLWTSGEINIFPKDYALNIFIMAPGGFIVLGLILAFVQKNKNRKEDK